MVHDSRFEIRLRQAVAELDRAGARPSDLVGEDHEQALRLEHEMMAAAGARDFGRFEMLVTRWRDLVLRGSTRSEVVYSRVLGREITLRQVGNVVHVEEVGE